MVPLESKYSFCGSLLSQFLSSLALILHQNVLQLLHHYGTLSHIYQGLTIDQGILVANRL